MADIRRPGAANAVARRTAPPLSAGSRLRPGFLAAVILAQVGACLAFSPLLQVLVPLKAAAIAPGHKGVLLSQVLFAGAVTAALANLAVGLASDRTRSRFGRRRPWMALGLIGALAAYALIARAATPWQLITAIIVFQLLFNAFFSAFAAAVAERTPDARRGVLYAMMALGPPVGSIAGLFVVGDLARGALAAYGGLGLIILAAISPFIILLRDAPAPPRAPARVARVQRVGWTPDFLLAMASRMATATAQAVLQGFALFAVQDRWDHLNGAPAGLRPEQAVANLLIVAAGANLVSGLVCGWRSDRAARRKSFILPSAIVSGLALAACGLAGDWATVVVALIVFGCASGCCNAVGSALLVQVLPSLDHAGRDLGMINLSNTAPQALAPLMASLVMRDHPSAYQTLFLLAAALAVCGGMAILPIKGAR